MLKEGATSRLTAIRELFTSVGGSLESATAAASSRVAAAGVGTVSTTVLLTAAQVDEAAGRSVTYRAPGS